MATNPKSLSGYVAVTGVEGITHLRIGVSFNAGGLNYFNYKTEPKGYDLTINAVKVDTTVGGFTSVEYGVLTDGSRGARFHLAPATRFSFKTLKAFATTHFAQGPVLSAAYAAAGIAGVKAAVLGALAKAA